MSGSKTTRRRDVFASAATAFALCAALVSGCAKHNTGATAPAPLRISQRNEPASLDPQLAALPDEFFIIRALSQGLLVPGPDGGPPEPGAAEQWSVSADGLTWTFELRADGRWSSGDPVTAGDFLYSIHRALTPAFGAPKVALFFPLRGARDFYANRDPDFSHVGARALDARHLELTLESPLAEFAAIVASGPWIPVHAATVEKFPAPDARQSAWTRPGNFVGNGLFSLESWQPNQVIVVRARPDRPAPVPAMQFVAFDNGESEERAFRAGQIDVTMAVPVAKLEVYRREQPSALHVIRLYETRYLALNPARAPLNDPRVRRALSLALDRAALTDKVLRGGQRPAYHFLPSGLGGYTPEKKLSEDAAEARRLLAEAGFPGGQGFPKLEFTSWATTPVLLEAIQQAWHRELGLDLAIGQREARVHLAALAAGNYDVAMATAIPDYNGASDLLDQLKTGDPGNYVRFADAEFDRLVSSGERTAEPAARLALYRQAEARLLEQLPLVPLYFNAQDFLLQPRVKVWPTDPLWTRFYREIRLE